MLNKSIAELANDLRAKKYSSVELTQFFLERIKRFNPTLNSFITCTADLALEQARAADARIATGTASALTGIPVAHKDLFCTKGVKTTCCSKMLDNFIAPYESTVSAKFQQAGAILLGKTNMDEFAMGSTNENSYYGPCHNPWDLSRITGGSSGGSACAVAARLTPCATGTDTGGSVRQPAAMCGITGLKPTYGLMSRFGMVAFASSLDQAGILASSAEDVAIILNHVAGFDPKDSTSIDAPIPDYTATLNQKISNLTVGLPREYFKSGLNDKMATAIHAAVKVLEKQGCKIKEISLPSCNLALAAYYIIAPAECSSNLARFDGVRYGYRCANPQNLDDLYKRSRSEAFGDEVKRRIMIGTYVLSSGYYDAYYVKAQKIRRLICRDFKNAFDEVDVIINPTTPTPAFKIGDTSQSQINIYLNDIFTVAVNLADLPAISVPAGFVDNLPVGMQLIGNHLQEKTLLNVAHQFQQLTDWHKQMPNLEHNLE